MYELQALEALLSRPEHISIETLQAEKEKDRKGIS